MYIKIIYLMIMINAVIKTKEQIRFAYFIMRLTKFELKFSLQYTKIE